MKGWQSKGNKVHVQNFSGERKSVRIFHAPIVRQIISTIFFHLTLFNFTLFLKLHDTDKKNDLCPPQMQHIISEIFVMLDTNLASVCCYRG